MSDSFFTPIRFHQRLVILGFGCIGQGILPLIFRHIDIAPTQIVIITANDEGAAIAQSYAVPMRVKTLNPENYTTTLREHLRAGDFLLNVSVGVSSVALIGWCQSNGVLYLDTSLEPWPNRRGDSRADDQTNYQLREAALALNRNNRPGPTALIAHGANPGLVSYFVKQALLELAAADNLFATMNRPASKEEWAQLTRRLNIKTIQISEQDAQIDNSRQCADEFVNTWSPVGFIRECLLPVELGWGLHENHLPASARQHGYPASAAIVIDQFGCLTQACTWTPSQGHTPGFLISHQESISISEYLTLWENNRPVYRPTTFYVYRPCAAALRSIEELTMRNWVPQNRLRTLQADIDSGFNELGVLLMGHAGGAFWYGSHLNIDTARALAPHNNATSLQVTAPAVAGMIWAITHPTAGIVESNDIDHDFILQRVRPYLGDMIRTRTCWTPLGDCRALPGRAQSNEWWAFENFLPAAPHSVRRSA